MAASQRFSKDLLYVAAAWMTSKDLVYRSGTNERSMLVDARRWHSGRSLLRPLPGVQSSIYLFI